MKTFALLKFTLILGALAAALTLSPACKAQSEVNPDHFDGTDSWAVSVPAVPLVKFAPKPVAPQVSHSVAHSTSSLRPASKPKSVVPAPASATPIHAATKRSARKPKTQRGSGGQ
jgi:hypothetical protein